MRLLLTAALLAAALPMVAQTAVTSASATGNASVKILPADVTISHSVGAFLNFGTFKASAGDQTVTIETHQGAAVGGLGAVGADHFTFTKDKNENVRVTADANVLLSNGTKQLTATLGQAIPGGMYSGYEVGNTAGQIWVGGTLTIPAWTPKGDYNGTYNVTAAYGM